MSFDHQVRLAHRPAGLNPLQRAILATLNATPLDPLDLAVEVGVSLGELYAGGLLALRRWGPDRRRPAA